MGVWSTGSRLITQAVKRTPKIVGSGLKTVGETVHGTSKFVADHKDPIARATQSAIKISGQVFEATGQSLAKGSRDLARELHQAGNTSQEKSTKLLAHGSGYVASAFGLVGRTISGLGQLTQKASPGIGTATGSALDGVVKAVSGAVDSVAITEKDFEDLQSRLRAASLPIKLASKRKQASIALAQRERRKDDLLDLLVVGGVTLGEILRDPSHVPAQVERAFSLAYPGLARSGETFDQAVDRMSANEIVGLVNGVKGKLFELELVDHMNAGNLPEGLHAQLSASATQPGHDIEILDEAGQIVDVLQAKATESVAYVREALKRYPDIDVTTTTEVHAKLMALGVNDGVINSGYSEAVLQQKVEHAVAAGLDQYSGNDWVPSTVGLAVIALSTFVDKGLTIEQKGAKFGERTAKVGVTGMTAKAALVATNTWWLGLAVGVSSRWLISYGGNKRERYEALLGIVQKLEESRDFKSALALPYVKALT